MGSNVGLTNKNDHVSSVHFVDKRRVKMQMLSRRCSHGFQIKTLDLIHGFHRLLLHSTATPSDPLANFLTDSLGFSQKQALSISTKSSRSNPKVNHLSILSNATSVVSFFKTNGFDDTLIAKIVSSNPRLLSCSVDKTITPKFNRLKEMGFSGFDIITLVSRNPNLLGRGLESVIVPAIQNFRKILGCDSEVIQVMSNLRFWSFSTKADNLFPNVALLTDDYGIPFELIRTHLINRPLTFLRNPGTFKGVVSRVEHKLGIRPDSPVFLYGVYITSSLSDENIESKFRMLKSFGWTQSDIETFIMKNARCFTFSDVSIKKKTDFLMNELRLEPAFLTANICLFTCSLEKRVVPRHKVLMILKEKSLLTVYPGFPHAVKMPETSFLKRFVLPFKEVHKVYANHTGCSLKMLELPIKESADNVS